MDLNDFVKQCHDDSTRWFPEVLADGPYHTLALAGEVGEFANIVKKILRGSKSIDDFETKEALGSEAADIFTYLMLVVGAFDIDLEAEYDRKREFNERRFGPGTRVSS
jgi:NTP pyrophosphatase (non-canonical NTP hydrolase)